MDNFTFTESVIMKSKIIHIRGKIIYSFFLSISLFCNRIGQGEVSSQVLGSK